MLLFKNIRNEESFSRKIKKNFFFCFFGRNSSHISNSVKSTAKVDEDRRQPSMVDEDRRQMSLSISLSGCLQDTTFQRMIKKRKQESLNSTAAAPYKISLLIDTEKSNAKVI